MTFSQLQAALKKKDFVPVYLFHGPESYFIDQLETSVEANALAKHEKAFNHTVLYGKDADPLAVVDAARRFPMMAERQLVVIREAQDMRSLNELANYASKPAPTTVLVLCHKHKKVNGNSKLVKAIKANGLIFEAKALYDNQVPAWISGYLRDRGYEAEPAATNLLAEYLGTALAKIANELDKLLINLPKGSPVTTAVVEEQVGISKEYNVFELQKALGQLDRVKVARIITYFSANPKAGPLPVVLASLYGYFSKLLMLGELRARSAPEPEIMQALNQRSNYFLREYYAALRNYPHRRAVNALALLREYDLKSKGVGSLTAARQDGELLKELTFRIMRG